MLKTDTKKQINELESIQVHRLIDKNLQWLKV